MPDPRDGTSLSGRLQTEETLREGVPEISTSTISHESDLVDDLGEISISPDVSDLGSAVMSAIDRLTPEGGIIRIPNVNGIITETTIDLSEGVAGQHQTTPIRIVGPSSMTNGKKGTAFIDGSTLSGSFIRKDGSARENVVLENLVVKDVPPEYTSFDIGSEGSFASNWILRNLRSQAGGDYGFNLNSMYGSSITKICALNSKRGIRLGQMNAASIDTVISRYTQPDDGVHPAVEIHGGNGMDISNIYSEGNFGKALSISGNSRGWNLSGIYFEQNGRSGAPEAEFVLGDSDLDTGTANFFTVSGSYQTTFRGGPKHILLDDVNNVKLESFRGTPQNVYTTGNRGHGCTFMNCQLGDVETASSTGPSTWIQNHISGSVDRHPEATVISGD